MGTIEILNSLAMIFIMIIPGFILKKRHIIDEHQTKGLSSIIVNITWPCLVINAMQVPYTKEIFDGCKYIFFLLFIIFIAVFILAAIAHKVFKLERSQAGILAFMLIFSNTGFIGMPVINALYGKEALFYASMVEMVNDILIFTIGVVLIQISAGLKAKLNFKDFINPGLIGIFLGFILFLTSTTLPKFLGDSVSMIGAATSPLSMFVIGSQLGDIKFKEIAGDWKIYGFSFVKLLIVPAVAIFIVRILLGEVSLLSTVVMMSFAMPAAAVTVIFAQQFNGDVKFATKGVLISTLLCLATIPVFAILLR